ncbi:peptidoglycan-binding domain-containing protein [Phyllobacterium myrsinacearum]|uniref:Peptidoglycan hydrolase-like protein with peptidoglycan-binding domain n=1 Tax=Phyllobacterium myrsinacearum TaxID=28101 RepID=A0A839EGW6_9HYPH|nr:peptidoglycan-binding protein [Phyllobacterium myrsinacearum]MBA8876706.1 peptidoglycan hydrolase-like protein with peptidoglycan-binding domain [Phyllobacterium myrsinacearum]
MRKPANRPDSRKRRAPKRGRMASIAIGLGGVIARNPTITGGATAFLVTLGFISANALWYQPQGHDGVFFRTRPELVFKPIKHDGSVFGTPQKQSAVDAPVRRVNSVPVPQSNPDPVAAAINGDPVLAPGGDAEVAKMQQKLLALGFYNGAVDGLAGKGTRAAIEAYRKASADMGIETQPAVGNASDTTASIAIPAAKPDHGEEKATVQTISATPADKMPSSAAKQPAGSSLAPAEIVRIQAGLRAFGNDKVEIDGKVGASTKTAITEFQNLFKLPVTGEPDAKLLAKMQEIGLIN